MAEQERAETTEIQAEAGAHAEAENQVEIQNQPEAQQQPGGLTPVERRTLRWSAAASSTRVPKRRRLSPPVSPRLPTISA